MLQEYISYMNKNYKKEIIDLLCEIKDPGLMDLFLQDILTPSELEDIIVRWQIIKQLGIGTPQREISKKLGISIAKITRGSRMLYNTDGGFNKMLKKKKII